MSTIQLTSIKYTSRQGSPKEWSVDLPLKQVNLLVGKNATGKSRSILSIRTLAKLLVQQEKPNIDCTYTASFQSIEENECEPKRIKYELEIKDKKVLRENLYINDDLYLDRQTENSKIRTFGFDGQPNGQMVKFSPPENALAVATRRDDIQHKYLNDIYDWAMSMRFYRFGDKLGKNSFAIVTSEELNADENDEDQVVGIFSKAAKASSDFINSFKNDMQQMGYLIDTIELITPSNIDINQIPFPFAFTGQVRGIGIKEDGLDRYIEQDEISQGMFRSISILIQVNYLLLSKKATAIIIDDIGEGLDFDRSSKLIEILRTKVTSSNIQLIMTTNDSFVMNKVPLDEWVILQRTGGAVKAITKENAPDIFDDFKFTGLSSFSMLEMDFIANYPPHEAETPQ
jgi:predicted ATPase